MTSAQPLSVMTCQAPPLPRVGSACANRLRPQAEPPGQPSFGSGTAGGRATASSASTAAATLCAIVALHSVGTLFARPAYARQVYKNHLRNYPLQGALHTLADFLDPANSDSDCPSGAAAYAAGAQRPSPA